MTASPAGMPDASWTMAVVKGGPQIFASILLGLLSVFIYKFIQHRQRWRALNLPGPPHHSFWGHLRVMGELKQGVHATVGPGAHLDHAALDLAKQYGKLVYLDLWPVKRPMCIVTDPIIADALLRGDNVPKALEVMHNNYAVLGRHSMVLAESTPAGEKQWKNLRAALAPGFRKSYLEQNWVDSIVTEVDRLMGRLTDHASSGQEFKLLQEIIVSLPFSEARHYRLQDMAAKVCSIRKDTTADIILNVALGVRDTALRKRIMAILNQQIAHGATANVAIPILDDLNPSRQYFEWRKSRQMAHEYKDIIDEHIRARDDGTLVDKGKKDMLDFMLLHGKSPSRTVLLSQIYTLIFGGHDTTASTLSWAFYHIAQSPENAAKARQEVLALFGADVDSIPAQIAANPRILNDANYISAISKEALRMYPPASSVRIGPDDYIMKNEEGRYPLAGCYAWISHFAMHRLPDNWDEAEVFKPERWLDEKGGIIPTPAAWMPFSRGPKNCIGLELALMEQRVILASLVCKFDFTYTGSTAPYQSFKVTTRPSNMIPMRVSLRRSG